MPVSAVPAKPLSPCGELPQSERMLVLPLRNARSESWILLTHRTGDVTGVCARDSPALDLCTTKLVPVHWPVPLCVPPCVASRDTCARPGLVLLQHAALFVQHP